MVTRNLTWGCLALAIGTAALEAQLASPAPPAAVAPGTNAPAPAIAFATPVYDAGRVRSGDPVKYTYVFTNTGAATLELKNVQPSCGCTTAGEWTRKVEPGQTGVIPVQFNTGVYSGLQIKTINVTSSDPAHPTTMLQLKVTIWKPVDVTPTYAIFNVPVESPSSTVQVRLVNNTEEQISLSSPESNNRAFTASLSTNQLGKECVVTVSSVPPLPVGSTVGEISVKTTSTNAPLIKITALATVQPAVVIAPPQVILPQAPLAAALSPAINIQSFSTNQVSVTDPAVNLPGVEVQLNTVQTGRVWTATLRFPQGFEIPPGRQVFFTAKSTHPQFQEIKVPVTQLPRPVAPAPVAQPSATPQVIPPRPGPQAAAVPPRLALPPTPPTPGR